MQLLVQKKEPSIADSAVFYGECGGEMELLFELQECCKKGWKAKSKRCIRFTKDRCNNATRHPSLELSWLRETFKTEGKVYKILSSSNGADGFPHELVEVKIGSHHLLLFHNTAPGTPTGLLLGVTKIDGIPISEMIGRSIASVSCE
jgi:hypothetical protein